MEGPVLKYRSDDKLHIYQGPGIKSWIIFSGFNVLGLSAAVYGLESVTLQAVCIACCHAMGWAWIQEWQDCVIDKSENLATLTRCNWYDRLCCRVSTGNTTVLPLETVVAVETKEHRLLLVLASGVKVPVVTDTSGRHLSSLKQQLSAFLRLSHVEVLPPGFDRDNYIYELEDSFYSLSDHEQGSDDPLPAPLLVTHDTISRVKILVEPPEP